MTDASSNEQFHASSFLQGHNAEYVEQLHARYMRDPGSVDPSWRSYFDGLAEDAGIVIHEAAGAPWRRMDWPPKPSDELTAALDGNWDAVPDPKAIEKKIRDKGNGAAVAMDEKTVREAVLDSIRAHHVHPLVPVAGAIWAPTSTRWACRATSGIRNSIRSSSASPRATWTERRPIFIDNVLGLETATMREIEAILKRTYQGTFALQFMHLQDPEPKSWLQQRIEGLGKEISFTKEGRKAILNKLIESRASRSSFTSSTPAPSGSAWTAARR